MSRQAWLRDRSRPRSFSKVDPRPLEAAVLSPEADSMRDLVNRHMAGFSRRHEDDQLPEDEWLSEDDWDLAEALDQAPHSEYQLDALGERLQLLRPVVSPEGPPEGPQAVHGPETPPAPEGAATAVPAAPSTQA